MSKNIPKKLAIKAELLRHLETATKMRNEGKDSSDIKIVLLELEIDALDNECYMGDDPTAFWRLILAEG